MATPKYNPSQERVMEAVLFQAELEAAQRTRNPALRTDDPYLLGLRREEYQSIIDGYSKLRDLSPGERQALKYVRKQIAKINSRLQPTLLNRIRYSPPVDRTLDWLRGNAIYTRGYDSQVRSVFKQTTQESNVHQLSEEMKRAGFTVSIEGPLKKAVAQDRPYFAMPYAATDDAKTDFVLFFRKFPDTNNYYLEKFDAAAKLTVAESLRANIQVVRHTFSMIDEPAFSAKDAGRLVHQIPIAKTVEGQERWFTVDSRGQRNSVIFDLEQALRRYPIIEMNDPVNKHAITEVLRNGSNREVTFAGDNGQTEKLRVQVDPYAQGLLFKDKDNNLVDPARLFYLNPNIEKMLAMAQEKGIVREMHHSMKA